MTSHDDTSERLSRANIDDARQRAASKVEDAADVAAEKIETEAREVAAALTGEVADLRKEITILAQIDNFKGKIYVVATISAIFVLLSFGFLVYINNEQHDNIRTLRTDLEIHRIRNEASHDCLAEKMGKLPPPEARADPDAATLRQFVQEFLGCVAEVAPTIIPPGAPSLNQERRRD